MGSDKNHLEITDERLFSLSSLIPLLQASTRITHYNSKIINAISIFAVEFFFLFFFFRNLFHS